MITSTKNQFWIVSVENPQERIPVQFTPRKINLSRQAKIDEVLVIGRNYPRFHHSGGSEDIKLTLEFYGYENIKDDVWNKIEWLRGMMHNDGFNSPPPLVNIVAGDLFKDDTLIIKSINVDMETFEDNAGWLPRIASVEITFCKVMRKAVKRSDILNRLPTAKRQVEEFGALPTLATPQSVQSSPEVNWEFVRD